MVSICACLIDILSIIVDYHLSVTDGDATNTHKVRSQKIMSDV